MHIQADDIFDLLGQRRVGGALEGAQAMRLQAVGVPDALHRVQRQADRFGHRAAGPVRHLAGRLAAGQRQYLVDSLDRHRLFARRPGLVAQQTRHPGFGVAPLPTPHCRTAHPSTAGHLQYWQPFGREHNNAGALHMLQRPIAITNDRFQIGTILVADEDTKLLLHAHIIPYPRPCESPVSVSALGRVASLK